MKKITYQLSATALVFLSSFSVMAMDSVMTERFFEKSQESLNKPSVGNAQSTSNMDMDMVQDSNRDFDTQGKPDNARKTIKFDSTR